MPEIKIKEKDGVIGGMKQFKKLETKKELFQFSSEKEKIFDLFYKSQRWEVKRIKGENNKYYDCLIKKDGIWYKIEEKYRDKKWEDLIVELIQDTKTNAPGWIYYTKAQYLFYGMGDKIIYVFDIKKLRNFIDKYKNNYETKYSKKGWGNTKFIIIPMPILLDNKVGKILCKIVKGS